MLEIQSNTRGPSLLALTASIGLSSFSHSEYLAPNKVNIFPHLKHEF